MNRIPKPNEIYQHFKGNLYKVITLAKHSETGEMMVVYQALYGSFDIYVRPLESFVSEVDHEKYPQAAAQYRFTLIPAVMDLGTAGTVESVPAQNEPAQAASEHISAGSSASQENSRDSSTGSASDSDAPDDEPAIDPALLDFLDADSIRGKLEILTSLHERITDAMLNTMAVSLDLELAEGRLEDRYYELKNCLITMEKYECERLR